MNKEHIVSDTQKILKIVFLFAGLATVAIGVNNIAGRQSDYLGYLLLGSGVSSIGYSFGTEFFTIKWGPENHKPKIARIISAIGYLIIIFGGGYALFGSAL